MKPPTMDESGVIQFPAPALDVDQFCINREVQILQMQIAADIDSAHQEAQGRDVAEIEATEVALDLARDLIATLERRDLFLDGRLSGPAGQAVDLLIEYVIWRKNRIGEKPTPAKFKVYGATNES